MLIQQSYHGSTSCDFSCSSSVNKIPSQVSAWLMLVAESRAARRPTPQTVSRYTGCPLAGYRHLTHAIQPGETTDGYRTSSRISSKGLHLQTISVAKLLVQLVPIQTKSPSSSFDISLSLGLVSLCGAGVRRTRTRSREGDMPRQRGLGDPLAFVIHERAGVEGETVGDKMIGSMDGIAV